MQSWEYRVADFTKLQGDAPVVLLKRPSAVRTRR